MNSLMVFQLCLTVSRHKFQNQTSGLDCSYGRWDEIVIHWRFQTLHDSSRDVFIRAHTTIQRRDDKQFPNLHNSQQRARNSPVTAPYRLAIANRARLGAVPGRTWLAVLLGQVSTPKDIADCTADCVSSLHLAGQRFLQG